MSSRYQTAPDSPAAGAALDLAERMQSLADAGDWEDVETLVRELNEAVTRVPDAERWQVVQALRRRLDTVAGMARQAREDVSGQLSKLRRGEEVRKAYDLDQ